MGCGASRGQRSSRVFDDDESGGGGAHSTEMLRRYNHKASVKELQHMDRELAQEIISLRRHTNTERQRLVARVLEVQDGAATATEQLRDEVQQQLESQLGDFRGSEFAALKWELAASSSHVSHLGVRLQDCREQRQVDQQQTADALTLMRRDFTQQVAKLTERVETAQRFALAAEAAQRRAEADAEARAQEAAEQRRISAAESATMVAQVQAAVAEKLKAVETADLLFGIAEARAATAEAAQQRAEQELVEATAQTGEATEIRTAAMKALREHVMDSNLCSIEATIYR